MEHVKENLKVDIRAITLDAVFKYLASIYRIWNVRM